MSDFEYNIYIDHFNEAHTSHLNLSRSKVKRDARLIEGFEAQTLFCASPQAPRRSPFKILTYSIKNCTRYNYGYCM